MPRRRTLQVLGQILGGALEGLGQGWQSQQAYSREVEQEAERQRNAMRQLMAEIEGRKNTAQLEHKFAQDRATTADQRERIREYQRHANTLTEQQMQEGFPSTRAQTELDQMRGQELQRKIDIQNVFMPGGVTTPLTPAPIGTPISIPPLPNLPVATPGLPSLDLDNVTSPDGTVNQNELNDLRRQLGSLTDPEGMPSIEQVLSTGSPPSSVGVFSASAPVTPILASQQSPEPSAAGPGADIGDDPIVQLYGQSMPCSQLEFLMDANVFPGDDAAQAVYKQCPGYRRAEMAKATVERDLAASTPEMMEGMTGVGAPTQLWRSPREWAARLESQELPERLRTPMPTNVEDALHWQITRSKAIDEYVAENYVLPFDDSSAAVLSEVPRLRQIVATLADFRTDDTGIPGTGLWLLAADHGPVDRAWQGMKTWVEMNITRGNVVAAQYAAILQGYVALLAGVGGEGANRLSDQDIVRARTLIPRPNDSLEVANALIGQLNRAVTAMQSPLLNLELYPGTTPEAQAARMRAAIDEARAVLWEPVGDIPGLTEAERREAVGNISERMCDDAGETVRMIYDSGRMPDQSIDPSRICA